MASASTSLDDRLRAWLAAQHVFFTASAPSGPGGHVNCSPKGLDSLRVLDERTVGYLDFVGSGAETIAHVRENGRLCVMFCAFSGPPKIVRLHGTARIAEPPDPGFAELLERFTPRPSAALRAIVVLQIERIAESCGFGVPVYDFVGERDQMAAWAERKGARAVEDYQRDKNARSLDGLPALRWVDDEPRTGIS